MNHPAASGGVSKPKSTTKVYAPRGGELDPERLNYASAGQGSPIHLGMELFKSMMATDMAHVRVLRALCMKSRRARAK